MCLLTVSCSSATLSAAGPALHARQAAVQPGVSTIGELTPAPPLPDASPLRLLISRISVDASVEARGLDAQRNLATPADFNHVAWYNQGPQPGHAGNAIINGHVNWWTGSAVFTRLGELRPGDAVTVIRRDGNPVRFKVTSLRILAATARDASLFAAAEVSTLTLITCTGPWDALRGTDAERLLVTAALD